MFGDGYPILVDDPNSEWSEQQFLQGNHRSAALEELIRLRNTLQKWVAFDDADASGDDMDLANDQRLMVLNAATDVIDEELFGRADDRVRASSGTRALITASPGDQILAEGAPDKYPVLSFKMEDGQIVIGEDGNEILEGRPQDAAVLARLDAVIEALSDEAAFADAFDSGGVFSGTYATDNADLEVGYAQGLTPGQIWKKAQHRIDLLTDRSDFTRFGVWTRYFSKYPSDDDWRGSDDYMADGTYRQTTRSSRNGDVWESEVFAYSPLPVATYAGVEDAGGGGHRR